MSINIQQRSALISGHRGATLVEVVMFIVIIATALSAVLGTLSLTVGRSSDPLVARHLGRRLEQRNEVRDVGREQAMAQP